MTVRRATEQDIPDLVTLRRAMWDEMHPSEPADEPMLVATADYLRTELAADHVRVWISCVEERAVGMAILLVHEHPPRIRGRELRGYVTAVYMKPEHRRRGHAAAMLEAIVRHGREAGLRRLMLRTSEAGRGVYESVGFRPMEVLAQDF